MSLLGILGVLVSGGGVFGLVTLFFKWLTDSQRQQGALEERQRQNDSANEAIRKADDVLAEHRDPDGVTERLRRGDF